MCIPFYLLYCLWAISLNICPSPVTRQRLSTQQLTTQPHGTIPIADQPLITQHPASLPQTVQVNFVALTDEYQLPPSGAKKSKRWSNKEANALLGGKDKYAGQNGIFLKIKNDQSFADVLQD